MNKNTKDILGQRFGRLVAIKYVGSITEHKRSAWLFKCDCGNEKVITYNDVSVGRTKSCGCIWREKHQHPKGDANFNQIIYSYKRHAKERNLSFDLSKDEFKILTQQNCYYCGDPPSQSHAGTRQNGVYIYNGIDRIDNTKGYILDNCVSCCGNCNKLKLNRSNMDFLLSIKKIYEYMNLIEFEID